MAVETEQKELPVQSEAEEYSKCQPPALKSDELLHLVGYLDPHFFKRNTYKDILHILDNPEPSDSFLELGSFKVQGQGVIGFKFVPQSGVEELKFQFDPPQNCGQGHSMESVIELNRWRVRD
eukprot:11144032-Ditylum_brightwellii.AAC.2